jgi:hypothetical protein
MKCLKMFPHRRLHQKKNLVGRLKKLTVIDCFWLLNSLRQRFVIQPLALRPLNCRHSAVTVV